MNGPCRFHSSRRPPVADASTAAETLQIFIVGRHDDRRPAGVVFTEEGLPIALHRAIEIIEFGVRSEEHTSELQSLMRISYAVFCLKQKKTINTNNNTEHIFTHLILHKHQNTTITHKQT